MPFGWDGSQEINAPAGTVAIPAMSRLVDEPDRENEGDICVAAEAVTAIGARGRVAMISKSSSNSVGTSFKL